MTARVQWGILGTASIARQAFLPAVAEAGGVVAAVASRDADHASRWASAAGIDRAVGGYHRLIEDPGLDAIYIPLPNSLHAEWTIRCLRAGKPVLCEKPLAASPTEARQVLAVARESRTLLWEAFVFPFHDQMQQVREWLAAGMIGELREVQSSFHFPLSEPARETRLSAGLAGGALNDVGCYPVRLARDLFAAEHKAAEAAAVWDEGGVDVAAWGWLEFPGERRLMLSCGFRRAFDTFTRLLGTAGQVSMNNPFHPQPGDRFELHRQGREPASYPAAGRDRYSFTPAIRHIQAVIGGSEQPRWLAVDRSLGSAQAIADLTAAARSR